MPVNIKNVIILLLSSFLVACASTSLMESWKQAELKRTYQHLMIIGISDSQQTRQIYEKYFVARLKKRNMTATPSYTLINSKQKIERDTVMAAIQDTDIDSVLVSYLVSADIEFKQRDSPLNTGYSGSAESSQISATIVSNRGQSRTDEIYVIKSDFYDVQSKKLVWSARTKTVGPESVDVAIKETTSLLIKELYSDEVLQ